MSEIISKVEAVKQREKNYSLRIGDIWYSGWGIAECKKEDLVRIEYEITEEGWHNINKLEIKEKAKDEEKIEKQKTLIETDEEKNQRFNYNAALMTRCYKEAYDIVKSNSADGYPNPESVTSVAITLFLSFLGKRYA